MRTVKALGFIAYICFISECLQIQLELGEESSIAVGWQKKDEKTSASGDIKLKIINGKEGVDNEIEHHLVILDMVEPWRTWEEMKRELKREPQKRLTKGPTGLCLPEHVEHLCPEDVVNFFDANTRPTLRHSEVVHKLPSISLNTQIQHPNPRPHFHKPIKNPLFKI
ncbi:hypothetical protein QJS10_CPB11g00356 [Acorus calamus]|uniref:Uncharacterized protein n=1 Tax=Acorus calamus TaxID=4465 RepID=A0AAV9DUY5_ACOCL|nr:hypothetical protein QJS10_CPB11g00356 [Acorus calamus]